MTTTPLLPEAGANRPDAETFGRALPNGLGINLLVTDVAAAATFQAAVLGAEVSYFDADFAILSACGSTWMLHHDRTYRNHPLSGIVAGAAGRGAGVELRLYGCDPDRAEAATQAHGGVVLAGSADKPHGIREAFLLDPEGYLWVPSIPKMKR